MCSEIIIVPGPDNRTAYEALEKMAAKSTSLRGAVAFVTTSGVDLVEQLMVDHAPVAFEVVARGAPITQPSALLRLAKLGAKVSLVIGEQAQAFHPKLWLASYSGDLDVLAGSGNLTEGGLRTNDEQFEYLQLTTKDSDLIVQHEQRFQAFADQAIPLSGVRGTPYWAEWEKQMATRQDFATKERELDGRLAAIADASIAIDQLYTDLLDLYERTKAEVRIPAPNGGDRPYVASRFKNAIDRGRREGTLVPVVRRIVRSATDGFDRLAKAKRPDLMVETMVLDTTKPYHHLFSNETMGHAQATIDAYQAGGRIE